MMPHWLIFPIAYLLGSIPFGYLIVKLGKGRDVRATGSGNIGAANVSRAAGTVAGVATLLLDAAKGYAAVWIAGRLTGGSVRWMIGAALLAILGHMFPVWLGFRGGKGVATGVGVFLPICPPAVLAGVVLWLVVLAFWRYISLASIVAATAMPLLVYALYAPPHAPPRVVSIGAVMIAVLIIWRHRGNIGRLINGSEPRFKVHR